MRSATSMPPRACFICAKEASAPAAWSRNQPMKANQIPPRLAPVMKPRTPTPMSTPPKARPALAADIVAVVKLP